MQRYKLRCFAVLLIRRHVVFFLDFLKFCQCWHQIKFVKSFVVNSYMKQITNKSIHDKYKIIFEILYHTNKRSVSLKTRNNSEQLKKTERTKERKKERTVKTLTLLRHPTLFFTKIKYIIPSLQLSNLFYATACNECIIIYQLLWVCNCKKTHISIRCNIMNMVLAF